MYSDFDIANFKDQPYMDMKYRGLSYEAYQILLDKVRGLSGSQIQKFVNPRSHEDPIQIKRINQSYVGKHKKYAQRKRGLS